MTYPRLPGQQINRNLKRKGRERAKHPAQPSEQDDWVRQRISHDFMGVAEEVEAHECYLCLGGAFSLQHHSRERSHAGGIQPAVRMHHHAAFCSSTS